MYKRQPYHHITYSISSYPILRIIIYHTPYHHISYSVSSYLILRIIPYSYFVLLFPRVLPLLHSNNAYIFPGVGLGALAAGSSTLTDEDFYVAAKTLAALVPRERLDAGCAYPALSDIRYVSLQIAAAVAASIVHSGRAVLQLNTLKSGSLAPGIPSSGAPKEAFIDLCAAHMYMPSYD